MFSKQLPTVDGVMSAFHKTIDNLRGVASAHAGEAQRQREICLEASARSEAARTESARATETADRLEAIFNS